MLGLALAAVTAVAFGAADYCGGRSSRAMTSLLASWASFSVAASTLVVWLLLDFPGLPQLAELGWGVVSGVATGAAVMLFFYCLARGAMSVVAPVTAVTAALMPVVAGLATGERPATPALAGIGCAIVSIGLVSWSPGAPAARVSRGLIAVALLAGAGFGLTFVFLDFARAAETTLWPAVLTQGVGAVMTTAFAWRGRRGAWSANGLRWAFGSGALAGVSTGSYLYATDHGDLAVVGTIASLYPASTVLLALVLDRERLGVTQAVGLLLAGASLCLVGVG